MAAANSAPLPAAWTRILEQIETALHASLDQSADPADFAGAPVIEVSAEPAQTAAWSSTLQSAETLASAAEAQLTGAEQSLRDWLAAVQTSRVRLEGVVFPRI
jgi:hypothetical protein